MAFLCETLCPSVVITLPAGFENNVGKSEALSKKNSEFAANFPMFHVEHFPMWKPGIDTAATRAIHAKYNSLVHASESGIAKAVDSNYAALKSLGSP